jgi:hypothetical protein
MSAFRRTVTVRLKPDITYQNRNLHLPRNRVAGARHRPEARRIERRGRIGESSAYFKLCNRLQSVAESAAPINIFVGDRRLANSV